MVNYLWLSFMLVVVIVFNQQCVNLLVVFGVLLLMFGICWVFGGDQGFDLVGMLCNVVDNLFSYGLVFVGVLIWVGYCMVIVCIVDGKNGVMLFFMLVVVVFWIKFVIEGGGGMMFSLYVVGYFVLVVLVFGFGYVVWNIGIMYGNVMVIVGVLYFMLVFVVVVVVMLLYVLLLVEFW